MRRFWTLSGGLATAASLGLLSVALRPSSASPPPGGPIARIAAVVPGQFAAPFIPRGAGSCAAAACHGSAMPGPAVIRRDEHTVWIDRDPHATAYDVLLSDRSKSIAKNLGVKGAKFVEAHEDARCLACHATPTAAAAGPLASTIQRDGVGCESCHGPSGSANGEGAGWLSAHTTIGWDGLSPAQKAQYGFNDLRDYPTRAMICAGCHVGAPADPSRGLPARDVNHDLIAAGHPRLNFELSAYVANYPKHWRQDRNPPDLDARLWKIGQAATLRAALDLLQDRCERAASVKGPWPELSEYGCFSCHFNLKLEKPFRAPRKPGEPLGVPLWASWHLAMLPAIADADPQARAVEAKLAALRKTMETLPPDENLASRQAGEAKAAIDSWLGAMSAPGFGLDQGQVSGLISSLNRKDAEGRRPLVRGWDSAAQLYLGLAAMNVSRERMGGADPALSAELKALREKLAFPPGLDSPKDFNPGQVK